MKYRYRGEELDAPAGEAKKQTDGSYLVGGKKIWVARTAAGIEAWCEGKIYRLERAEATRSRSSKKDEDVTSPMTGKVTKVLVKAGDAVENGQVLIIVEAMKMEYRITSPKAGKITKLNAKEGQQVEMGAVLADVE